MTKEEKITRWELLKTTELMVKKTIDEFGYDPLELTYGSHKKALFKCSECCYEWLSEIANRSSGKGCPECFVKNRKNIFILSRNKGKKLLYQTHPKLCEELVDKEDSFKYTCGSGQKVFWKCYKCSYIWNSVICSRSSGSGCPSCAGQVVTINNCLKTLNPELYRELLYPSDGEKYTINSGIKVWWKCIKCNYKWQSNICNRSKGQGCPNCYNINRSDINRKIKNKDKKLLHQTHPDLCKDLKYKEDGKKYTKSSRKKVWWVCSKCGNEWKSVISGRSRGQGCPSCNKQGGIGRKEQEFINNFVKSIPNFSFKKTKKGLYIGQQYTVPFSNVVNGNKIAFIDFAIKHPKLSRIFLLEYDELLHKRYIKEDTTRQKEVYKILKKKYETVTIVRVPEDSENKLETIINEFSNFLNNDNYKELVEFPKDIWN